MQDVKVRLTPKVEDSEQVVLLRNVLGTADLIAGHVEWEELPEPRRLHLQHPLAVIGIIEREDVEAYPSPKP